MADSNNEVRSSTNENDEERLARIKNRRAMSKFGECREQGPGVERGITCLSLIAFPIIWSHEEKEKVVQEEKKKRLGIKEPPKKAYVPVHDRRNPYSVRSEEKRRQRRPLSQKAEDLLSYCQSHLPSEKAGGKTSGKKKKKAKKQKLKHSLEYVSIFMELGIKPPKTTKDLPQTISELNEYLHPSLDTDEKAENAI